MFIVDKMVIPNIILSRIPVQVRQYMKRPLFLAVMFIAVLLLSLISVIYNHSYNFPKPALPPSSNVLTKHHVMLLSYGRSGSSFTAALIARHPDVFYTFEPLYYMARLPDGSVNEKFVNTEEVKSRRVIDSFLNCEFPADAISKFDNSYHRTSDSSKSLFNCLSTQKNGFDHFTCYQEYIESCKKHKMSFIKTIRFKVKWTEWFFKTYSNFKLIILIRDPRAVLFSQSSVFRKFDWKTEVTNYSQKHCDLLSDDIQAGELLMERYPGRVLGIRYEDGALDPLKYAEKIYRYLGLEYGKDVIDYIKSLTNEKEDQWYDAYSIEKRNSTIAMNRWRYLAGFISVNKTEEICGHLISKLGYRFVLSQKDLESDRLLVGTPEPGSILR